jgi:hypothetical protein
MENISKKTILKIEDEAKQRTHIFATRQSAQNAQNATPLLRG